MSKTALYIYIAVVFGFTLISVQGENVKCKDKDSIFVGAQCYKFNFDQLPWTEAEDDCVKYGGKLATFTSLDDVNDAMTAIEMAVEKKDIQKDVKVPFWVGTENVAEEIGILRAVAYTTNRDKLSFLFGSCKIRKTSHICTETDTNATTHIDLTAMERNTSTTTIKNDMCIHNDSMPVDGLCFRLSDKSFEWSNARSYCESWKGKLATISSVQQGIKVLTAMSKGKESPNTANPKEAWITDPNKSDQRVYIKLTEVDGCNDFVYGRLFSPTELFPALCIEMPIINSESNPIELTTTTQTLINKQDSTTEQLTTHRPESITENESNTATTGQDKRKSTTTSKSTTLQKSFFEMIHFKVRIENNTGIGYYTNDLD